MHIQYIGAFDLNLLTEIVQKSDLTNLFFQI